MPYTEAWSYSSGALNTVSSGVWALVYGSTGAITTGTGTLDLYISGTGFSNSGPGYVSTVPTVPGTFLFGMTVQIVSGSATNPTGTYGGGFELNFAPTTSAVLSVPWPGIHVVAYGTTGIQVSSLSSQNDGPIFPTSAGATHTIGLQVIPNYTFLYFDGALIDASTISLTYAPDYNPATYVVGAMELEQSITFGGGAPSTSTLQSTLNIGPLYFNAGTFNGGQTSNYTQNLFLVGNGHLYGTTAVPSPNLNSTSTFTLASNQASAPLIKGTPVYCGVIGGQAYFVGGVGGGLVQYDIGTNAVINYAATAGMAPASCTLACAWRTRLVVAGDPLNPQNLYFARVDAPQDWNYAATDPAAAFASNFSQSGQIGDPITALIPWSNDIMLVGCAHSVWMVQGDPADGGSFVNVSTNNGITGPASWLIAPDGKVWWVGSGGLFNLNPIWAEWRPPTCVSEHTVDPFFYGLTPGNPLITMVWDADLHHLYVFDSPLTPSVGTSSFIVYDTKDINPQDGTGGSFWPCQFPLLIGPTAICQQFGNFGADNRTILLGGYDGYLRHINKASLDDDGTPITSSVTFGPYHPSPEESGLSAATFNFGELWSQVEGTTAAPALWSVSATLVAGANPIDVLPGGGAHKIVTWQSEYERRNKTLRQRLQDGWFSVTLGNNVDSTYWTFEDATLEFEVKGRQRTRR